MLWLTDILSKGINIDGFWALVWATIAVWVVNVILEVLLALILPKKARA
jgi:uncharacterized membrane protein YvlD (DUF360 family)